MHLLRCIVAEWQVVRARLVHTRLGVWLLLLAATLAWLYRDDVFPVRLAVRTGLLAGVLCVAFAAGSDLDRAALRTTLGHPTSPLALATGRWLAATVAAALPVMGTTFAGAVAQGAPPQVVLAAGMAGIGAAAAVTGCALPAVLLGGNAVAALLLVYVLTLGMAPTDVSILPNLARYATPDGGGALHAASWAVGGVLAATAILARPR